MNAPIPNADLFREELRELLAELDAALLELDADTGAGQGTATGFETLNRIFRALHTLKGACDMAGFHDAVALLHDVESLWDQVRTGRAPMGKSLANATFAVKDWLEPAARTARQPEPDETLRSALCGLAGLAGQEADDPSPADAASDASPVLPGHDPLSCPVKTLRILFAPSDPHHFAKMDPASLLDEVRRLGQVRISLDTAGVPALEDLDPSDCHLRWDILLETRLEPDAVRDVFLFLDNPGDAVIEERGEVPAQVPDRTGDRISAEFPAEYEPAAIVSGVETLPEPDEPADGRSGPHAQYSRPEQAGTAPPKPTPPDTGNADPRSHKPPEQTAGAAPPATSQPPAADSGSMPQEPPPHRAGRPDPAANAGASAQQDPALRQDRPKTAEPAPSLRVEAAKLDNLVNLVGELVIAQARLTQIASELAVPILSGVSEEIERLAGELRDNTLSIRMLPIGTTFSRFKRLVRDLSSELGKEIELATEGGETELDKTVIEQLGDPLVHLLRNSIDHGVEPPEERAATGKPRRGTILLSAKQAGGSVVIRIEDDGRGLNAERIRAKAAERGLLTSECRLADQDAYQLIFSPGFSTAEKITSVSGRGVGMDVVKRAIENLRGSIEISSRPGRGTAITITLPLTLAIIDGLLVRAAGEFYIIPLAMVEECVELAANGLPDGHGGCRNRTLNVRGEIIPYIRLRETFLLGGAPPRLEQVVITRHDGGRTGLAVDEVVGQQQTVIKGLGPLIGRVEGFSGATINGDGSMALILDVVQLVGSVQRQCDGTCTT
ncbi:MAG: chemotaxis protein CheW [Acidobacteriota bacterium]